MTITKPKPGEPWWVPASIPFVKGILLGLDRPNIFEWGSGGSTEWLFHFADDLVSVEHDQVWIDKVFQLFNNDSTVISLYGEGHSTSVCIIPKPLNATYEGAYTEMVHDRNTWKNPYCFDFICVDGRRRVQCIEAALEMLPARGFILLDNSERERYKLGIDFMKDWEQWHFNQGSDWRTSIWRKP